LKLGWITLSNRPTSARRANRGALLRLQTFRWQIMTDAGFSQLLTIVIALAILWGLKAILDAMNEQTAAIKNQPRIDMPMPANVFCISDRFLLLQFPRPDLRKASAKTAPCDLHHNSSQL